MLDELRAGTGIRRNYIFMFIFRKIIQISNILQEEWAINNFLDLLFYSMLVLLMTFFINLLERVLELPRELPNPALYLLHTVWKDK